ncbi:cystathionine beta-lyase [Rhodomicrobium vannielii ATCC 17100]|uniref:cystathionine beta-lyase n=1 Tax=Rhodomicrobium vannielii TaxID=1069 RepID=UPI001918F143|nr:cystathionine beta-lyase [Rhodomicrobium vannielii]MBJ7534131.1 cystathionine beta-lyase [Rhodomicrobium vannielii ATCC 17100]
MTGEHGSDEDISVETQATQLGRDPQRYFGFVNMPVYRGSTVLYPNAESLESQDIPYTYGRPSNPTTRALEEALAKLEGGARTFLAPSGLSAVSTLLLAFAEAGGHILITDSVYFPTRRFAGKVLKRLGVDVEYYDPLIGGGIAALIRQSTKLVFTESPGSQTFEVQDIPAICAAARGRNVPVAIDNTWATPLFFRPFDHGVNISVQAATKYIVGHADALLGAITCDAATAPAVAATHEALGLCVNGEDAFLALRGLRTLPVRLKQHQASALAMAEWLAARPEVARVLHPALPDCPGHELWKRDFLGSSGLFTIVLKPQPKEAVRRFLNALRLFGMGYSWGGYESLIVPFDCTHSRTATKWQEDGPALRLHIGLEDVRDLKRDLERGFAALAG